MMFVVIFVVAMLIVPLIIDIEKHGADNILRRSADDVLKMPFVKTSLRALGVAVDAVNPLFAGIATFTFLGLVAYGLLRLLGAILHMLF